MDAQKVIVKICAGTHCYLMGGSELQLFSEYLPDDLEKKISIVGSSCLGFCDGKDGCKPPFVVVNSHKIPQANIQNILAVVKKELES